MSQINYTITNYAAHTPNQMSHDAINRYLREDRLTSRLVWEHARSQIQSSPYGYVIFDDTGLDKNFSHKIELVRLQFPGNAHGLIKGIGLVNCVYVNHETGQYWVIDFTASTIRNGTARASLTMCRTCSRRSCSTSSCRFMRSSWIPGMRPGS
nr:MULTISPECIES: hypothetical protein [Noviherbaspirillum]